METTPQQLQTTPVINVWCETTKSHMKLTLRFFDRFLHEGSVKWYGRWVLE